MAIRELRISETLGDTSCIHILDGIDTLEYTNKSQDGHGVSWQKELFQKFRVTCVVR